MPPSHPVRPAALVAATLLFAAGCTPSGERALVEGDRLLRDGKVPEAVRMLEHAVETLPQDAAALNHLGMAYQAANRLDEARRAYLRALEIDRGLAEAHHNLALVHEARGDWLEAERSLRTYLTARPEDGVAWARLGSVQFSAGRLDDAERSLATAKRFEAAGVEDWNTLGLISVQRRRYREARDRFLWARRLQADHPAVLLNLAVLHHQQLADPAAALGFYRAWLATGPAPAQAQPVQDIVRQLEARLGGAQPPRTDSTNVTVRPVLTATNAVPVAAAPRPTAHPTNSANPASTAGRPPSSNTTSAAAPTTTPNSTPNPSLAARSTTPSVAQVVPPPAIPRAADAAGAPKPETARPTVPPPTAQPAKAAPAAPTAPVRREVVQVEDDAPLVAAKDTPPELPAPAKPAPVAVATASPATEPVAAPAADSATAPADGALTVVAEPVEKSSIWKKMNPVRWGNPVRWFRKDKSKDGEVEEAPTNPETAAASPVEPPRKAAAANPPPPARPAPAKPVTPVVFAKPAKPTPPRYTARAGNLNPGNRPEAEREFAAAAEAHRRRDLAGAAAGYRRATAADPTHFESHHNLALVALDQGDLPLALLACENALQLKPGASETRRTFALALKQGGYTADAADQLEEILAVRPTDSAMHLAAAALYVESLDDLRRARRHYEAVLALEPSHPQADAIRSWLNANPNP